MRSLSSASTSTFATRLRSSPESIRSTTVSQGLVAGMPETIATSFGSRRRFLMIRFGRLVCFLSGVQNS